jgi:hypothetical protein
MKFSTLYIKTLLIPLILATGIKVGHAQSTLTAGEAEQLTEKTALITDRETYCVQENILFSAFNISSPALRNPSWSNVLYLELIAPDGQTFAQRKYAYSQHGAEGSLKIPANLLTGNYYLRAYTRWMRDYSPYNYFYKMITVINPFRPELLEGTGMKIQNENIGRTSPDNLPGLLIRTDKKIFDKREKVNVEITAVNNEDFIDPLTVAVIPKETEKTLNPVIPGLQKLSFSPDFIPETRGLSISGKVVNAADSLPIPYTLVGLTVFKENPETHNVMSNEKGQFFFDLAKLKGSYEIFISAKSVGKEKPLILVDNDFSTQKISLPFVAVDLSGNTKKMYQILSFNSQIQQHYEAQKTETQTESFSSDSAFYGPPDFVLRMKEFIAMPTLKDYIIELMPQVAVRHEDKTTMLKVLGTHADLSMYAPMVLLDMVAVFDIDRILAVPPDRIERIEVVSEPYIRGDITYGGIISFFSKKGDLAGIDLPSAGRFITYSMLNSQSAQVAPMPSSLRIPAIQNCLYWNPSLPLKTKEPQRISFDAGDSPGDYLIVVRSLDKNHKIKVSTMEIRIN